jgi:hypothetical protein
MGITQRVVNMTDLEDSDAATYLVSQFNRYSNEGTVLERSSG